MELCIDRVTKQYRNKIVVDRISAALHPGITGLLGANGAGKTTLMRMACGILRPTSGEISLDGITVDKDSFHNVLGYLPQHFGYYPEFTARDFLMYFAALKGLSNSNAKIRCAKMLKFMDLDDVADRKIKTYSGGMKQRVGIAVALLNYPKVLILDEPTVGLDPIERARFKKIVMGLKKVCIVLLSTHIVSDLEDLADNLLILDSGKLIYSGEWNNNSGDMESFYLNLLKKEGKNYDISDDLKI